MIFPNIQAPSHHYRKKNNILFSLHETLETPQYSWSQKFNELRNKDSATGAAMPTPMQQAAGAWNKIVLVGEFAGEFYSYESDFIFGVFCT